MRAGSGVVMLILGALVLTGVVFIAFLFDRHGEGPFDRPMNRDEAKQTPVVPPTKPQ
jgi:hypothetical protein